MSKPLYIERQLNPSSQLRDRWARLPSVHSIGERLFRFTFLMSFITSAHAEVNLTTPNGTQVLINDTASGSLSVNGVVQNWPLLCLQAACPQGDCSPCQISQVYDAGGAGSSVQISGRQRATATISLSGFEVSRRIYIPLDATEDADGFIRVVDTIYNPTTQARSIAVNLGSLRPQSTIGSFGSQIWRTSSYDAEFNLNDRWVLLDDNLADAGQDNTIVVFQGAGGTSPDLLQHDVIARTLSMRYNEVMIPAQQRVNFITVLEIEPTRINAIREAKNLVKFRPSDITFGLDSIDRRAIYNIDINPDNACPIADLNGPYNGSEGQAIQLSAASSFDLEGADLVFKWDLDGDGLFGEPGLESSGANLMITYPQDGVYPVALEVTDPLGKSDRDYLEVNVRNVNPIIDQLVTNSPINEGGTLELLIEGSDIGIEDLLRYEIDWLGDGVFEEVNGLGSHLYASDGTYFAQARVSDQDGGVRLQTFQVTVNNLAPIVQQVIANNPSNEGAEVRFVVQATDAGQDPLSYHFDFDNDGTFDVSNSLGEARHIYPEDGSYITRIEVRDDLGATGHFEYPISVQNVAPNIENVNIIGDPIEGSSIRFSVNASDVGSFDLLRYEFNLDGQEGFEISQSSPELTYTFPDSGRYQVQVRVSDDESAIATRTLDIDVANVPPSGALHFEGGSVREGLVATADQGRFFEVVATATDPSSIDERSLSFNWDLDQDGVYEFLSSDARQPLSFNREGTYLIRCLIRDKDFGELILEREISIAGRPPELHGVSIDSEAPYSEGTPVRFTVEATDADPLTYAFDFNDDGFFDLESDTPTVSWAFPNEGDYRVKVRVSDESGFVETDLELSVINVAPTVELNTGANVGEGDDLTILVTPRDPGEFDEITVVVRFQDQTETVTLSPNQTTRFTLPTQDDGFIDITAQAVDDAGAQSIEYTARAFIENRPPFIPPFSPSPAREGVRYTQVIPADDPAGLNDLIFYSLIDPPSNVEIEPFSGLLLWTPSYEDYLNSPISFELLIEDEDGGRLEREISIEVLPKDEDQDGIPDTYEASTCERFSPCLSGNDPSDAEADPDEDGRSSLEEWLSGTDPFVYEGPEIPRLLSPGEGEVVNRLPVLLTVSHVESDRPLPRLSDGTLSPRELALEYQVFADANGESLVEESESIELRSISENETNRWSPRSENLIEDQLYWWRARSIDGPASSEWSELRSFRLNVENLAPEQPTLALPLNGSVVADLTPTLSFNSSMDPDRESLYYVVRVYRESPDGVVVDFGGQVQGEGNDGGVLSFTPSARLQENARYQWDVVAIDEIGLESEPSERWSFIVDLENEAPSDPSLISPQNGDLLSSTRPLFQAGGSVDQEGAEITYHFAVRAVGDSNVLDETPAEGVIAVGGVAEWRPTFDLIEDQEHIVSLFASDGIVQTGMVSANFFVSAEDHPPEIPTLLEPSNNALVAPQDAVLIWSECRDPERGRVRYQVEYCSANGACQESGILNNNSFSLEGLIPRLEVYSWRARSLDDEGNTSGYSAVRYITLSSPSANASESDGGCTQRSPKAAPLWVLMILLLARGVRLKRVQCVEGDMESD